MKVVVEDVATVCFVLEGINSVLELELLELDAELVVLVLESKLVVLEELVMDALEEEVSCGNKHCLRLNICAQYWPGKYCSEFLTT